VENEVNSLDVGSWTPLLGLRLSLKVPKKSYRQTFIKDAKPEDSTSQSYDLVTFSDSLLKPVSTFRVTVAYFYTRKDF
jgi:hypothetical protein